MVGLIKKLIRENLSDIKKEAAGVLIKSKDTGRFLLLLRNDERNGHKTNRWALLSGTLEPGETPLGGLKREVYEEIGINPDSIDFEPADVEYNPEKGVKFYYYKGLVDEEFEPTLDIENLSYGWFSKDDLPSPLYPGLKEKIFNF